MHSIGFVLFKFVNYVSLVEFSADFERRAGWQGHKGHEPPKGELSTAIAENDFYVYCGHGTSEQYFKVRWDLLKM